MSRYSGTVSRGLRTQIFNQGDRLEHLIPDVLFAAAENDGFTIQDRDVLCITESIVARTQGNYAHIDDIANDLRSKLPADCQKLGICFPILSRNRFAVLLRGMARAVPEIVLFLSYPSDEVGNNIIAKEKLMGSGINPWEDVLTEAEFLEHFGAAVHPFTGINYVEFYKSIVETEDCKCTVLFGNDVRSLAASCPDILCCDIHSRFRTKTAARNAGARTVLGMDDILNAPVGTSGYNPQYGLLGSNKADDFRVKLFPRNCQPLVDAIVAEIRKRSGKAVEVMIYGDGAFKDPAGEIWELADPVVSPAYTEGLAGTPNELKLKYLADNEFRDMSESEQRKAITEKIRSKDNDLKGQMQAEGTTPRRLTDLLGSLADLTSGSGDKGTPLVYIQGYFDNFANE